MRSGHRPGWTPAQHLLSPPPDPSPPHPKLTEPAQASAAKKSVSDAFEESNSAILLRPLRRRGWAAPPRRPCPRPIASLRPAGAPGARAAQSTIFLLGQRVAFLHTLNLGVRRESFRCTLAALLGGPAAEGGALVAVAYDALSQGAAAAQKLLNLLASLQDRQLSAWPGAPDAPSTRVATTRVAATNRASHPPRSQVSCGTCGGKPNARTPPVPPWVRPGGQLPT